jgi:hypothetical protein
VKGEESGETGREKRKIETEEEKKKKKEERKRGP